MPCCLLLIFILSILKTTCIISLLSSKIILESAPLHHYLQMAEIDVPNILPIAKTFSMKNCKEAHLFAKKGGTLSKIVFQ